MSPSPPLLLTSPFLSDALQPLHQNQLQIPPPRERQRAVLRTNPVDDPFLSFQLLPPDKDPHQGPRKHCCVPTLISFQVPLFSLLWAHRCLSLSHTRDTSSCHGAICTCCFFFLKCLSSSSRLLLVFLILTQYFFRKCFPITFPSPGRNAPFGCNH